MRVRVCACVCVCVCVCLLNDTWRFCITEMMQRSKLQQSQRSLPYWMVNLLIETPKSLQFLGSQVGLHLQGQVDVMMFY